MTNNPRDPMLGGQRPDTPTGNDPILGGDLWAGYHCALCGKQVVEYLQYWTRPLHRHQVEKYCEACYHKLAGLDRMSIISHAGRRLTIHLRVDTSRLSAALERVVIASGTTRAAAQVAANAIQQWAAQAASMAIAESQRTATLARLLGFDTGQLREAMRELERSDGGT